MVRHRKEPVTVASLAGRLDAIEKRCRGCPHSRRVIGFSVDAVGTEVEKEETEEEFPDELKGEAI